jgi:hypothetical protein
VSGSPKYSTARLAAAAAAFVARALERRQARRRDAETQRATAVFDRARVEAGRRLATVSSECESLCRRLGSPAGKERLRAAVRECSAALDTARDATEVSTVVRRIDELAALRGEVQTEFVLTQTQDARQRLDALRAAFAEVSTPDVARFDRAGHARVDRALAELTTLLDHGGTDEFLARQEAVAAEVAEHRRHVLDEAAEYRAQERIADQLSDEVAARLAALVEDAAASGVTLADLRVAEEALAMVRSELAAGRPHSAAELGRALLARLGKVERDLDSAVDRIVARRRMLGAIVSALPNLGFAVAPGSLVERNDGSIGLRAATRAGHGLTVVVQDDVDSGHRINYLRDTDAAGQEVTSDSACDSLIRLAERLNDSVRQQGFELGGVTWDDKPGHRPPPGRSAWRTSRAGRTASGESA